MDKNRLNPEETAALLSVTDPELKHLIQEGAKELKERIYGNRIVLFAPLYVGNECINDCVYCGFRISNKECQRATLTHQQLIDETKSLVETGHKRLIMVYGEHPMYSPEFIAETVQTVYDTKYKKGEIRRVNINAAPLDIEGFRRKPTTRKPMASCIPADPKAAICGGWMALTVPCRRGLTIWASAL